ncbi:MULTISPECIES: FadR/GntR family transcriptional regulator [Rhodococcus]|uniref:Transcriptional regulator, GntR family protein n=1 Tax=Rhodococcus jostii (strain RHA1) TaxID=101510 RepID=Q0S0V3_RHOJR|nr:MULTISPECIES: FCD domain-containing protein [Rhodococcus]ABG98833.1 transcriptional regulator, GntR family protein [Rhodococcus jostii RHA1]EJI93840.1 transcriptional regulator, GntR family [Rhodococcus sp. JVH1]
MAATHRTVDERTGNALTPDDAHRAPGRAPKMSERIANQIADEILGGGIVAGDRLPTEKEMVAEYGVARTTVREALRLLESRGLVTIRAGVGGGPVACRPQFESLGNTMKLFLQLEGANLSDVIDTRLTLEPVVAQQATPRITDGQLDELQAALDSMRTRPDDYANFIEKNALFHTTIYTASGNPVLRILMETLLLLVRDAEPSRHPEITRTAAVEAQQLVLNAMRSRNASAAGEAMEAFVHDTAKYYRKRLAHIISEPVHWQL